MSDYNRGRLDSINEMLDAVGRPVMDGLATCWQTEYPQRVEYYRDNVGKWVQVIVNGDVRFDSRLLGVNL